MKNQPGLNPESVPLCAAVVVVQLTLTASVLLWSDVASRDPTAHPRPQDTYLAFELVAIPASLCCGHEVSHTVTASVTFNLSSFLGPSVVAYN